MVDRLGPSNFSQFCFVAFILILVIIDDISLVLCDFQFLFLRIVLEKFNEIQQPRRFLLSISDLRRVGNLKIKKIFFRLKIAEMLNEGQLCRKEQLLT